MIEIELSQLTTADKAIVHMFQSGHQCGHPRGIYSVHREPHARYWTIKCHCGFIETFGDRSAYMCPCSEV